MSESITKWYVRKRLNTPVICFFDRRTETFPSVRAASKSLDCAEQALQNAIDKGYRLHTAGGICTVDYLQE